MGGLLSDLFGSSPSSTSESNLTGGQNAALTNLLQILQTGNPATTGTVAPTNQVGAPLTPATNTSLAGLENLASGITPGISPSQAGVGGTATGAFEGLLTEGAPLVSPAASTAAFNQGVVQPLTTNFLNYTLPAIAGRYGAGAGGAFSSDALSARQQAGLNLDQSLAQSGSQYALATQEGNQQAQGQYNSTLANALGLTTGIANLPTALLTGQSGLLNSILQGGLAGQAGQQATDTAQTTQTNVQNAEQQNILQLLLGATTAKTQTPVEQGGDAGLIPSLITGFAGSSGGSSLLAHLLAGGGGSSAALYPLLGAVAGF